jgi:hypothetical protein
MDLLHRIVAMVESRPKRVVCTTCGSEHNYRPPKAATAKAERVKASREAVAKEAGEKAPKEKKEKAPSTSARVRNEAQRVKDWEERVLGQAATAFTRFTIDKTYSAQQLVLHKKFGEGYVVELLEDGKVAIMFRDGLKTLVHGHAAS